MWEKNEKKNGKIYYLSDLDYEIRRQNRSQGLTNKRKAGEKIGMVDIKDNEINRS